MLAGVPLLRARRHARGAAMQPSTHLAAAAKLAVAVLLCTNLVRSLHEQSLADACMACAGPRLTLPLAQVQIYFLFMHAGSACQAVAPCQAPRQDQVSSAVLRCCVHAAVH